MQVVPKTHSKEWKVSLEIVLNWIRNGRSTQSIACGRVGWGGGGGGGGRGGKDQRKGGSRNIRINPTTGTPVVEEQGSKK